MHRRRARRAPSLFPFLPSSCRLCADNAQGALSNVTHSANTLWRVVSFLVHAVVAAGLRGIVDSAGRLRLTLQLTYSMFECYWVRCDVHFMSATCLIRAYQILAFLCECVGEICCADILNACISKSQSISLTVLCTEVTVKLVLMERVCIRIENVFYSSHYILILAQPACMRLLA